jgi:glycosyltransferase involved in cell wall biosynthesis
MSHPTTVSVVIPCFNDGIYLPEAVESVTRVGRDDVELIVVDDGSSDHQTLQELRALETRGIHVLHQENRGLAAARNAGIRIARGEFILPLDSDNRIRRAYLDGGVEMLRNAHEAGVVYGDAEYFGAKTGRWKVADFDLISLAKGNYIDACALFRKAVWASIGGYDEAMPAMGWEDWEFWLRAAQQGWRFLHLDAVAFEYRVRPGSMLETTNRHMEALLAYIFGKRENQAVRLLREQGFELERLRAIVASRDYRVGRLLLDPLRKVAALAGIRPEADHRTTADDKARLRGTGRSS